MQKLRRGQVGLILLVITGVVVALVLSVASRTLSDTVQSRQNTESSAAFRLAESGVESALNAIRQGTTPGATIQTSGTFSGQFAVQSLTSYSLYVKQGDLAALDLSTYSGNTLTIDWTKLSSTAENVATCQEGNGTAPAAIEVVAINGATGKVTHGYYNPSGCSIASNGFAASVSGSGAGYRSQLSYTIPAGTTIVRIRPFYSDATIAVAGTGLKTQMYLIQSGACSGTNPANCNTGSAQSEIQASRSLSAPGSIFDYALFSGTTIVK